MSATAPRSSLLDFCGQGCLTYGCHRTKGSHPMEPGTRVRFVAEQLGTLEPGRNKFTEHIVGRGDEGELLTYPDQMPDGWLAVRPDAYPAEIVPVHPSMIEAV